MLSTLLEEYGDKIDQRVKWRQQRAEARARRVEASASGSLGQTPQAASGPPDNDGDGFPGGGKGEVGEGGRELFQWIIGRSPPIAAGPSASSSTVQSPRIPPLCVYIVSEEICLILSPVRISVISTRPPRITTTTSSTPPISPPPPTHIIFYDPDLGICHPLPASDGDGHSDSPVVQCIGAHLGPDTRMDEMAVFGPIHESLAVIRQVQRTWRAMAFWGRVVDDGQGDNKSEDVSMDRENQGDSEEDDSMKKLDELWLSLAGEEIHEGGCASKTSPLANIPVLKSILAHLDLKVPSPLSSTRTRHPRLELQPTGIRSLHIDHLLSSETACRQSVGTSSSLRVPRKDILRLVNISPSAFAHTRMKNVESNTGDAKGWLSDEIVNAYGDLINRTATTASRVRPQLGPNRLTEPGSGDCPHVYCVSTFAMVKIQRIMLEHRMRGEVPNKKVLAELQDEWVKLPKSQSLSKTDCGTGNSPDVILFPVHLAAEAHWILVVVYPDLKAIMVYDSLAPDENPPRHVQDRGGGGGRREAEGNDKRQRGWQEASYVARVVFGPGVPYSRARITSPLQHNTDDCGVMVLAAARHITLLVLAHYLVPSPVPQESPASPTSIDGEEQIGPPVVCPRLPFSCETEMQSRQIRRDILWDLHSGLMSTWKGDPTAPSNSSV